MKFRKETSSSPKMDLLTRRSSTGRLSTFKRTKSFRASVRIMSKIRNHTSIALNQNTNQNNQSTVSPQAKESVAKTSHWTLPFLQKKTQSESISNKIDSKNKAQGKIDNNPESRIIELTTSVESVKIAKDLKEKVSLANRIMGKNRKHLPNNKISNNHENREFIESTTSEKVGKSHSQDKGKISGKREYPVYPTGEYNSYENPTFCLDSSIDSSVTSFFFKVQSEDLDNVKKSDERNETFSEVKRELKSETLTIVVDSKRDNETLCVINDVACHHHYYGRNKKKTKNCCQTKEQLWRDDETKYNNYREIGDEENGIPINRVILTSERDKIDEADNDTRYESRRVEEPHCEKVSANSSKFLRPRTVDNIANFWNGGRSSFRVKKINHKKSLQESKNLESIIHDRVLVTTTSGSSRSLSLTRSRDHPPFIFFILGLT